MIWNGICEFFRMKNTEQQVEVVPPALKSGFEKFRDNFCFDEKTIASYGKVNPDDFDLADFYEDLTILTDGVHFSKQFIVAKFGIWKLLDKNNEKPLRDVYTYVLYSYIRGNYEELLRQIWHENSYRKDDISYECYYKVEKHATILREKQFESLLPYIKYLIDETKKAAIEYKNSEAERVKNSVHKLIDANKCNVEELRHEHE